MESIVVWQGHLAVDAITVRHDAESNRLIEADVEALIDTEWQRQLAEAASRGMTYFDSGAYRVNDVSVSDTGIELRLAPSPYRVHAAMKNLCSHPRVQKEHVDRHLIVDAMLRTADDMMVVHTVSKVVETETYLIGGSCSTSRTVIRGTCDLTDYLLDRVESVTGLHAGEREAVDVCGIVDNEIGCCHLIYSVQSALDSDAIRQRFIPGGTTRSLTFVPVSEWARWTGEGRGYVRVLGDLVR